MSLRHSTVGPLLSQPLQQVIVGGSITYNDGFPDSPDRTIKFCIQSQFRAATQDVGFAEVSVELMLPKLEKWDGWLNKKQD